MLNISTLNTIAGCLSEENKNCSHGQRVILFVSNHTIFFTFRNTYKHDANISVYIIRDFYYRQCTKMTHSYMLVIDEKDNQDTSEFSRSPDCIVSRPSLKVISSLIGSGLQRSSFAELVFIKVFPILLKINFMQDDSIQH